MVEKVAYSVSEVARELDCDVKTVRKGIAEGQIPSFTIGERVLRIPAWWMRQQKDGPTPRAA